MIMDWGVGGGVETGWSVQVTMELDSSVTQPGPPSTTYGSDVPPALAAWRSLACIQEMVSEREVDCTEGWEIT